MGMDYCIVEFGDGHRERYVNQFFGKRFLPLIIFKILFIKRRTTTTG